MESFAVRMSDIEALVLRTVGVVRVRRQAPLAGRTTRTQTVLRLRCEEFVDCANPVDQCAVAGHGQPRPGERIPLDDDDNETTMISATAQCLFR
jgi:hypothetical protein